MFIPDPDPDPGSRSQKGKGSRIRNTGRDLTLARTGRSAMTAVVMTALVSLLDLAALRQPP
jgi:hypothetical protein